MSRLNDTRNNVMWGAIANVANSLFGFISRWVFMATLGEEYLGVNSLFSSIITSVSIVDIGFAAAITFCFYKPIAENNIGHIHSLLNLMKKILNIVSFVIAVIGICLIPFLKYFVRGAEQINDAQLVIYYLLALSSTVISYWLSYRTCYISALQKYYKISPIIIAVNLAQVLVQIIVLIFTQNYIIWYIIVIVASLAQKIIVDRYIIKNYPETKFKNAPPVPEEDKKSIISNVKALIVDKFAYIFVTQTDNIMVSTLINISVTGLLSNYTLIRDIVFRFVSIVRESLIYSMGNLMVCEDEDVQLNVFYNYLFVNYCMIGFVMCGIGVLSTPFISLVFGPDKTIDNLTIFLMCIGYYFTYQTQAINTLISASGKFKVAKPAAIAEALSNVFFSIVAVKLIGLPGIFLGTLISQLINYTMRPFLVFKSLYGQKPTQYFVSTIAYFVSALAPYIVLLCIRNILMTSGVTIINFVVMALLTPVLFFSTSYLIWHKTKYGKETITILTDQLIDVFSKLKKSSK